MKPGVKAAWLRLPLRRSVTAGASQFYEALIHQGFPCRKTIIHQAVTRPIWDDAGAAESETAAAWDSHLSDIIESPSGEIARTKTVEVTPARISYEWPEVLQQLHWDLQTLRGRNPVSDTSFMTVAKFVLERFEPKEFDSIFRINGPGGLAAYVIEVQAQTVSPKEGD